MILWGFGTWLVLGLHDSTVAQDYSICGPWGCGPTVAALLSAHGFWCLVAIPVTWWAARSLNNRQLVRAGGVGLGLACGGLIILAGQEALERATPARPVDPVYLIQRILFAWATTVQFPLFPLGLAGLILLILGRRRSRNLGSTVLDRGLNATAGCDRDICGTNADVELVPTASQIGLGRPLPELTLISGAGGPLVVPAVVNPRASVLYFMRDARCSICRRHVRALVRLFEGRDLEVIIIQPGGIEHSRALQPVLPTSFVVVSGRRSGAYQAVGLSGRNLGLFPGSGTILVDHRGIIRHVRLASMPFQAFSEWELMDDYDAMVSDERDSFTRAWAKWSDTVIFPRVLSEEESSWNRRN